MLIDIFPYFGCWSVHHQVDWAIGSYLKYKSLSDVRVFGCSHLGDYQCAVSRSFTIENRKGDVCKKCQKEFWAYFNEFSLSKSLHPGIIGLIREEITTVQDIKRIREEILGTEWSMSLCKEIRAALVNLFKSLQDICDLTTMTHRRLSRLEIETLGEKERLAFSSTIIKEGLTILSNWNECKPDAVLLFNGRLCPYSVVWYLAKELEIRVIFHERGEYSGYLFCENSVPSAGEYVHEYIAKIDSRSILRGISDKAIMNGLKDMYRNIRNPANFPDLFNGVDKCKIADSAGIDNRILYIVSSDDEADCTPVSSIAAKQRYFIETICSLGEVKKSREIHIKVHPNIIGSHSYPGMEESLRFYQGLAVKYKSSSHVKIHLSPDIDPFSLVDDSKIVVGVHSTLIDYAWFSGKMIVTDRHAISRHLASTLIDFFSDEEIEAVLFGEMSEQHGKISAGRLVSGQLGYIALKDLCFDLNLGEVDISEGYFQPKNPRLSLDLKGDHQFEAAAYLVSRSLIEGQIINTLIFNHRLQSKTDSES